MHENWTQCMLLQQVDRQNDPGHVTLQAMMKRSTWHVKSIESSNVTRPCITEMHLSRETNSGASASSHMLSLPFARAPPTPAPLSVFIRCSVSPSVRRRLITSFRCYKHIVPRSHQPQFTGQWTFNQSVYQQRSNKQSSPLTAPMKIQTVFWHLLQNTLRQESINNQSSCSCIKINSVVEICPGQTDTQPDNNWTALTATKKLRYLMKLDKSM